MDKEWEKSLQQAQAVLERAAGAPGWLVKALAVARAHAADLAPAPVPVPDVPEFFYPH